MKDSERIREEIITILVLLITLVFTTSNLNADSSIEQSLTSNSSLNEAIDWG